MIRRVVAGIGQLAALIRAYGFAQGGRMTVELMTRQSAVRFEDHGVSYWMPRDEAVRHHLVHSVASLRRLAAYVSPGDARIVDVGAHAGIFAAFAAERAPNAQIIVIEADPALGPIIRRNLRRHSGWQLVQKAVGDSSGSLSFFRNDASSQTSSLVSSATEGLGGPVVEILVDATTLDELLKDDQPIDVLKVDVQGAERMVIRGGIKALSRVRTLLIEASLLDPHLGELLTILGKEFGPPVRVNPVYVGADLAYVRPGKPVSTKARNA